MDSITSKSFEFLPDGDDFWIILFWGRSLNDGSKYYQIELVLHKLNIRELDKETFYDFRLVPRQGRTVISTVQVLRAFSPGTIIHKKRIVKFIHQYRDLTKDIAIKQEQQFQASSIKEHFGDGYFSVGANGVPTISFESKGSRIVIPCAVLADYYFFGKPKLIQFILEGKIDRVKPKSNKVYNPKMVQVSPTSTGKMLAYIRLERDMFDVDAFKIARLAHDPSFWNKCIELHSNLLKRSPDDSFLRCTFPIDQDCSIKVFGREFREEKIYLVYKIIHCNSNAPFDALIVSRDNPGSKKPVGNSGEEGSRNAGGQSRGLPDNTFNPPPPPGKKTDRPVGNGKAGFNNLEADFSFSSLEKNNIDDSMVISEEFLLGSGGSDEKVKSLAGLVGDFDYTTNPEKGEKNSIFRMNLSAHGSGKPAKPIPTSCFELIENATMFAEEILNRNPSAGFTGNVIRNDRPIPSYKYSIFPLYKIKDDPQASDLRKDELRKFCFMYIKQNRFSIFRMVFIKQWVLNQRYFYIVDIEPKYSKKNNGYTYSRAIILTKKSTGDFLQITKLDELLFETIKQKGKWSQVGYIFNNFDFRTFNHTTPEQMKDEICQFVKQNLRID